jgi:hypothetical protein
VRLSSRGLTITDAPTSTYNEMLEKKKRYVKRERKKKLSAACRKGKHNLMCLAISSCNCACHEVEE